MSDLVGNPEDRFSRVTAHILIINLITFANPFFIKHNHKYFSLTPMGLAVRQGAQTATVELLQCLHSVISTTATVHVCPG